MDVYRFINSRDVAEYLRVINYEFSTPEAAYMVYQSFNATLDERIAAWTDIIETMPDCSMGERVNMEPIASFHGFLKDYIALKERELESFFESEGFVFGFSSIFLDGTIDESGSLFEDAESCLANIKEEYKETDWTEAGPLRFRLEKRPVGRTDNTSPSTLLPNGDFEVLSVEVYGLDETEFLLSIQFDGMWFSVPTPFKRGDIVADSRKPSELIVVDSLPTWGKAEYLANGFCESDEAVARADARLERLCRNGDSSGMCVGGLYKEENGFIWYESFGNYLDLEYQRVVVGPTRWSVVVSLYLKKEIDAFLAWNYLQCVMAESCADRCREDIVAPLPEVCRLDETTKTMVRGF